MAFILRVQKFAITNRGIIDYQWQEIKAEFKGTSKNSFLLQAAAISTFGDFVPAALHLKISRAFVTKAIFRGSITILGENTVWLLLGGILV
jgi:hypothetical protein